MSIYVDSLKEYAKPQGNTVCRARYWCHMVTDGELEELHRFAKKLGLREWMFQPLPLPHYDLTREKRYQAVLLGAFEVSGKELLEKCRNK